MLSVQRPPVHPAALRYLQEAVHITMGCLAWRTAAFLLTTIVNTLYTLLGPQVTHRFWPDCSMLQRIPRSSGTTKLSLTRARVLSKWRLQPLNFSIAVQLPRSFLMWASSRRIGSIQRR